MQSSGNSYTSVFVTDTRVNYDNSKSIRKQSCWRQWNRMSSLQRSVTCVIFIFGTLFLMYIIPALYHNADERDELETLSRKKPPVDDPLAVGVPDDLVVQPGGNLQPVLPQDPDQMVHHVAKPSKKGPPQLKDRQKGGEENNGMEIQVAEPPGENEVEKEESENQAPNPVLQDTRAWSFDDLMPHRGYEKSKLVNSADAVKGPQNQRQEAVVAAFMHSWDAYRKYAWGHDELKPETKGYSEWFGLGLTLIDSLDTMYIMGLKEEFDEARSWVSDHLRLDVNKDVNLFECTIRVLGGLLSSYHLSHDELFLEKAKEIGDRLMPAFSSKSAVPFADVNLKQGSAHAPRWGPDSSTSEVTTIQLEFRDLSQLTGDPKYAEAVDRVTEHVHSLPKKDGLIPIFINANTGRFRGTATITLGARGDSYYEYLLKIWLQSGKTDNMVKDDYLEAVEGIKKHLMRQSEPSKLTYFGELLGGKNFSPKMDHLVCFMGGALAMGAHSGLPKEHMNIGKEITRTCYEMYKRMPTGLSPEIAYFNTVPGTQEDIIVKPADSHNLERPETIESLFYLYRITGNKVYQEWGWEIFQSFEKYTKLKEGYTSISNVKNPDNPGRRNKMESFWLGETLKYFYLLFSDDQTLLPLDQWVFNTEAHPLPVFGS